MSTQTRRKFSKEFKLEAVQLVTMQGMTCLQVGRDLGINQSVIARWVREHKSQGGESFPGSGKLSPADDKVKQLERELRRTQMERDILKKAIAYFAEVPK